MSRVVVIGAGAAGMMAAISAAQKGHDVTIIEKNEKVGKKIYITGKGRCNITNACDVEELFDNVVTNKKFLYSAFYGYTNSDVIDFFNNNGLETKVERGKRVFPVSDRAHDVNMTLSKVMKQLGIKIMYETTADQVGTADNDDGNDGRPEKVSYVIANGKKIYADAVVVATGGLSYPTTGSTGDGYRFAETTGHRVVKCVPALVPFTVAQEDAKKLQGLALKNVGVAIFDGNKKIYEDFGELLFTHFGVSGPTVLSASSFVAKKIEERSLTLSIDLKPALDESQLDERILRDFNECKNKNFNNSLDKLLPKSLIDVVIERAKIDPYKKVNEISKEERERLVCVIKKFDFTINGLRGFNEAIITQGGVSVKDIDPKNMESKIVKGLYFAGEVIDLDAVTGGFNLQIAWSTGHLAGSSIE